MTEAAKKKLGETLFFLRLLINHREHIMGGEPHALPILPERFFVGWKERYVCLAGRRED
jgi:hypothetical protein